MKSILIIDDDREYREMIGTLLLELDFHVEETRCPDEAFPLLRQDKYDLIICDLHMPFTLGPKHFEYPYSYEVGTKTIIEINWACPETPIMAITATMPWDLPKIMQSIPHIPALSKPFGPDELLAMVNKLLGSDVHKIGMVH